MSEVIKESTYSLKKGETDSHLNKKIEEIILSSDDVIVYLADDMSVQWRTEDNRKEPKHQGRILGVATTLETQSRFIKDKEELFAVKALIAEAIARCLDGNPEEVSKALLRAAESRIADRSREIAWGWYFESANQVAAACTILGIFAWASRNFVASVTGMTAVEVGIGAMAGGVGALLSTVTRANRLVLDANAGQVAHDREGRARIGAGIIGGLFVALCVKGGLVLNGMHFVGSPFCAMSALCLVAGASERLVPSLLASVERIAGSGEKYSTRRKSLDKD